MSARSWQAEKCAIARDRMQAPVCQLVGLEVASQGVAPGVWWRACRPRVDQVHCRTLWPPCQHSAHIRRNSGYNYTMAKLSQDDRRDIYYTWKHEKLSIRDLSKRFGLPRQTIRRWVEEGQKENPCWSDQPRPGAPRKLLPPEIRRAKAKAKRLHSLKTVTAFVNSGRVNKPAVSCTTVWRRLRDGRHPLRWLPIVRASGLSPDNIINRVAFCEKHLADDVDSWVFADSKYFFRGKDEARGWKYAWQDEYDPPVWPRVKRVFCFHFYAFIAKGYKSKLYLTLPTALPIESNRKCKGEHFVEVMKQALPDLREHFGDRPFTICLDHAKQHKSEATTLALKELDAPMLADYPARSWDLNVIENAWGILNAVLRGNRRRPITKQGYWGAIEEAWEGVTLEAIGSLVDSVPGRMQDILEKEGQWLGPKK